MNFDKLLDSTFTETAHDISRPACDRELLTIFKDLFKLQDYEKESRILTDFACWPGGRSYRSGFFIYNKGDYERENNPVDIEGGDFQIIVYSPFCKNISNDQVNVNNYELKNKSIIKDDNYNIELIFTGEYFKLDSVTGNNS